MNPGSCFHERRVVRPLLRWIVPVAVILLAVAGPRNSAGSGPTTSTGVQVTGSVPFVRESIDEIRALAPMRERTVPVDRAIPLRRIQRRSGATGEAEMPFAGATVAAPSAPSSPAPSAPALDGSFAGLGNPPRSEGDVIPPDTMGAAGPTHLVSLLNSDFGVFNKTGTLLQKVRLQAFWASLGTAAGEPANSPFDPKILYDQHSGQFVAITLGGTSAPGSWVMIAVSSDPTGPWSKWAIDADLDNNVQLFNNSADFPGLGVDAFNVYVTANMFSGAGVAQYSKVWVIPKAQLLAVPPPPTITWFEFRNPPGSDFTMQPAHTFGAAAAEYFLFEGLVNQLGVAWMDNVSGAPVWHSPLQVPVAPYTSTIFLPGAPQLGLGNDNTIDTSDTRLLNTVYRNGSVWTTHHLAVNGKVEVAWYRINPVTGTLQSQGRITDPNRWYYYPSIAVNRDNVAAVGFSGSSTTEYVGGYYTIVHPTSNVAEEVSLLKLGEAPYYKVFTGTDNRWGDFSATVVDPSDDMSFWTLQEYAQTPDPATGSSRWGTWWGKFTPGAAPPPPPSSGGGGGGGCLVVTRSGGEVPVGSSLISTGILLLPACALGLRRFSRRRERTTPIRHPLC
jgi:hypothetical protein